MHTSPNKRFHEWVKSLNGTITDIIDRTGVPRRTLYNMFKDGHTLNLENLMPFVEMYGLDLNELFVSDSAHVEEKKSVQSTAHFEEDESVSPGTHIVKNSNSEKESVSPVRHIEKVKESPHGYSPNQISAFERQGAEILDKIERGPWSVELKMKMIESMISLVDQMNASKKKKK